MRLFTLAVAALLLLSINACKRCYNCYNQCSVCTAERLDTIGFEIDTLTLDTISPITQIATLTHAFCSDDSTFNSGTAYTNRLAVEAASGYTCTATNSTYGTSYCVNKPGDEQDYQNYYNKNGRLICAP